MRGRIVRPLGGGSGARRGLAPGHDLVSRRRFLAGAGAVLSAAALAPLAGSPWAEALDVSSRGGSRGFGARLDDFVRDRMRAAYLTSVTAAAVRGTKLVWSSGYGLADREQHRRADPATVYMLASVSKTFICAAAMQLWEEGSLDLDADVNRYLWFDVRNPAHPGVKITPRMLLTHTSSIRDRGGLWGTIAKPTPVTGYTVGDATLPLGADLSGYLVPGGASFAPGECYYGYRPGTRYEYSNLGADLAALLVQTISGTGFGEHVHDRLLRPLGMAESGYHLRNIHTRDLAVPYRYQSATKRFLPFEQYGYPDYPCGCMRTSAEALSVWLRCFMNGGAIDGERILKASTVREIMRPQVGKIEPGQGLIWYRIHEAGEHLIGHNGGDYGTSTNMYFSPSRGVGAITLTNRYIGGWNAWYAFLDIQDRLFDLL